MTIKKKPFTKKDKKELLISLAIIVIIGTVACSGIAYKIGKQIGRNENAPSCASHGLVNYVPPPTCYEVLHNVNGVHCCNWKNKTLVCGLPVFKVK